MPLYELLCIAASSAESAPLRDLVKSTSKLILENGGAVRGVQYWGQRRLPQRARRHQQYHSTGDYWLMHFDTNAPVLKSLNDRLRADPRVIKWTALKLGDKLDQITPKATSGGLDSNSDAPEARALFGGKTMRYGWQ
ncbi:Ribosomal protein S6 [Kalmanozyma brasiliensis GHG001]|uniref:30S ribosomal protein S6 n=2 Tax=Ustilaginaceae TaxID=5268 RepID=A0A5C3DRN1_9BASI|nr:Ribosomal protein S6 [Kalmanozyma brasiliensis GHG001]KAJ1030411.1 hypothetical protein NDA16_001320 [Ustilago loliicola]KAJ9476916.1 37S ribosomal protein MRP17, mitochondrial [Pseudozyma hubeiensis]SPO19886.1 uncharacterized protein UTRI_00282_B [Ustilago trichophora]EST09863.1 Ribosomal protein S6 [Kalmanozyma brasiliensis GHG001]SPO20805.1 uncharacterized protein UTRI_00282 [Ustilago trichophora]